MENQYIVVFRAEYGDGWQMFTSLEEAREFALEEIKGGTRGVTICKRLPQTLELTVEENDE